MSGADDLARRTSVGAGWALASTLTARLLSVGALAALARILTPADFGLVAFGLVFVTYVETIGDLGAGSALIYSPGRRDEAAGATFWIGLATGFAWLGLTLLLAPEVGRFFRNPAAGSILAALAWTFPLKALGNTHDALCQKDLAFRARFLPEAALPLFKGAVAVLLALLGSGVWSLVWGQLAGVAARSVLLWMVVPWRPRLRLSRSAIAPLLRYGRGIVAVNVLAAIVHHADLAVVGRMLGASALGLYQLAGKLPEITVALLVWVAGKVLFPAFARVQGSPERLRRFYLEALRWVALMAVPASVGLLFLAEPLLQVFFGGAWSPAAPILRALAIYTGLRALGSQAGDVLKATGRPGLLAGIGLLKAAVLLPALIVAGRVSAGAVASALAAVTAGTTALNLLVAARMLRLKPSALIASLRPGLAAGAVLVPVLGVWMRAAVDLGAVAELLGGITIGGAACLLSLRWTAPEAWERAADWVGSRRRGLPALPRWR